MTNQNKELIDSTITECFMNETVFHGQAYISTRKIEKILEENLSKFIILPKSKIEELIEKYKMEDKAEQSIEARIILEDLQSLLPTNKEGNN